jgi:hypothetical protein
LSIVLLAACASVDSPPGSATSPLAQRERDLTRAVTKSHPASVNRFLARDFSCRVDGPKPFTLKLPAARYSLCTGMGNVLGMRAPRSEYIEKAERNIPRMAEIETLEVQQLDSTTAVVLSTQKYVNWFPWDGSLQRRAEVRDTWVLQSGDWLLKERITRPLGETVAESR